jgi:hypothetical protein
VAPDLDQLDPCAPQQTGDNAGGGEQCAGTVCNSQLGEVSELIIPITHLFISFPPFLFPLRFALPACSVTARMAKRGHPGRSSAARSSPGPFPSGSFVVAPTTFSTTTHSPIPSTPSTRNMSASLNRDWPSATPTQHYGHSPHSIHVYFTI